MAASGRPPTPSAPSSCVPLSRVLEIQAELFSAASDVESLQRRVVERALALTDAAGSALAEVEGQELLCRAATGSLARAVGERLRADTGLCGQAVRAREVVRCEDSELDGRVDRVTCRRLGARSFVVAPLLLGERLMGLLFVLSPRVAGFGPGHEELLRLLAPGAAAALALAEEGHLRRAREREVEALREALREREAERDAALVEREETAERLLELLGSDLRAPLSPIVVAASLLLRRGTLDEEDTREAARIARGAERMSRMIGQVLDCARTRLGAGLVLLRSRVDLDAMAQDAVAEAELAHPERLVRYARRGETGGLWDRERLKELLTQLLDNALRHGDLERPVDVRVLGEGEEVVVEVRNPGAPIPEEVLPALFDPFRQAGGPRGEHLGLGLYIAREIALAHGGSLDVRSTEEEGTSFRVRLPRGPAPSAVGAEEASSPAGRGRG